MVKEMKEAEVPQDTADAGPDDESALTAF